MTMATGGVEEPPSGDGPLTLEEALQYADDFGPEWDGEALRVLAAEVRRLRSELAVVNDELGALQYSAGRMLDTLIGPSVRGLRAALARSMRNADRTGIPKTKRRAVT